MEFPLAAFILCVSKKVLSKSVALQYSRLGRKGKKHFEHVEEVYNAILSKFFLFALTIIMCSLKFIKYIFTIRSAIKDKFSSNF